jgi:DNA-binding MarR family transcriptional regulator
MEIVKAIRRILRKTAEHSRELDRAFGLSAPQVLCLRAISESDDFHSGSENPTSSDLKSKKEKETEGKSASKEPQMTVVRLSEAVHMPVATVSRILDRLEKSGYVKRMRGEDDRRRVHIVLTESGQEKLARIPMPLHETFLLRLRQLDQNSQESVLSGLRRVVDMMDASDLQVSPVITSELDVALPLNPRFPVT